jgi:hypothetical protein
LATGLLFNLPFMAAVARNFRVSNKLLYALFTKKEQDPENTDRNFHLPGDCGHSIPGIY